MKLQVVALKNGFYGGHRRRTGAVFPMELTEGKKLPKWVKAAPNAAQARAESAKAVNAERNKHAAGARAASGGAAAELKQKNVSAAINGATSETDLTGDAGTQTEGSDAPEGDNESLV